MSKAHESLLAGAALGCIAGLALFTRSQSMAWRMYGGLMLLLSAAILLATALAHLHLGQAARRVLAPARTRPRRAFVQGHTTVPLRLHPRRRTG